MVDDLVVGRRISDDDGSNCRTATAVRDVAGAGHLGFIWGAEPIHNSFEWETPKKSELL